MTYDEILRVARPQRRPKIRTLDGAVPHPSRGSWRQFLATCEIRDRHEGVIFYNAVNCNYILWPNGVLITNYGYHGRALMNRIREEGPDAVLKDIREGRQKWLRSMRSFTNSLARFVSPKLQLKETA